MFVPKSLVQSGDEGDFVWIVDADELAKRRSVELATAGTNGLVEIKSGLRATDKLIVGGAEGLASGSRVIVTGDDQVLGMK